MQIRCAISYHLFKTDRPPPTLIPVEQYYHELTFQFELDQDARQETREAAAK
jgi:hypothetical protein